MAEIKTIKTKKLTCPINDTVTIQFETDALDNFFDLHTGNGKLDYTHNIIKHQTLKTGIFSLKFDPSLEPTIAINQEINFILTISERKKEKWQYEIPIKFTKAIKKESPPSGPRGPFEPKPPYTRKVVQDNDSDAEGLWTPPEIKTIAKDGKQQKQWEEFFGEGDKALRRGAHIVFKGQNKKIGWYAKTNIESGIRLILENPEFIKVLKNEKK